jgi:aminoglycoside phosphotransferase (APT) family kinase protein
MTPESIEPGNRSPGGLAPDKLDAYLRDHIPGTDGAIRIEKIAGGQSNPTFFVSYDNARLVLRKQPPGELLPSAHAIDREYRVMKALAATEVPVPKMVLYCDDRSIVGTPFYVMERIDGDVHHDCTLRSVEYEHRRPMYHSLAHTLARLHNVDFNAIGLSDYGKSGNYFARQVARWSKQWTLSQTRDDKNVERLIEWLPRSVPDDETTTIAHGDYRLGNAIFHRGLPIVAGVLDWELSTLGHPLADLAHCCIAWHSSSDEYGGLRDCNLAEAGIPDRAEFESVYYEFAGHGQRMTNFHMAFALFRFAVIFEGIASRAKAGNAADKDAARTGLLAARFAELAVAALDRP